MGVADHRGWGGLVSLAPPPPLFISFPWDTFTEFQCIKRILSWRTEESVLLHLFVEIMCKKGGLGAWLKSAIVGDASFSC